MHTYNARGLLLLKLGGFGATRITTIYMRTLLPPLKESGTLTVIPHPPYPSLSFRQPLTHSLSIYIHLFCIQHINAIIQ